MTQPRIPLKTLYDSGVGAAATRCLKNAFAMTRPPTVVAWLVLLFALAGSSLAHAVAPEVYRAQTNKPFSEVMDDLTFAITSANFRETSRNSIGKAIAGRDDSDFPEATVVHFCSLTYAHQLLRISMDYLIYMPCRIALWQSGENVVIETSLVPDLGYGDDAPIVKKINRILIDAINSAAEPWSADK